MHCPACGAATISSRRYAVAEYMLGSGEQFQYEPCGDCGSSCIADPPADLGRFYPRSYEAFRPDVNPLLRLRVRFGLDERQRAFRRLRVDPGARLLDVGCGAGDLLRVFAARGFRDLTGVDPFLPFPPRVEGPIRFVRGDLGALAGERFDVITMHHVIEHVPDTRGVLAAAADALAPGGRLLVRTPLRDSWAAERYGARWVQHDAPRHLVLLTSQGLERAAGSTGLRLVERWRDEGRWQAWATAELAAGRNPFRPVGVGTKLGRLRYSAAARRRNRAGAGDQGCFVFARAGDAA